MNTLPGDGVFLLSGIFSISLPQPGMALPVHKWNTEVELTKRKWESEIGLDQAHVDVVAYSLENTVQIWV